MMTQQDIIDAFESCQCPIILEIPKPEDAVILNLSFSHFVGPRFGLLKLKYQTFDRNCMQAHFANSTRHPVNNQLLSNSECDLIPVENILDIKMVAISQSINLNAEASEASQGAIKRFVLDDKSPSIHQRVCDYLNTRPQAALDAAVASLNQYIVSPGPLVADNAYAERCYFDLFNFHRLPLLPFNLTQNLVYVAGAARNPEGAISLTKQKLSCISAFLMGLDNNHGANSTITKNFINDALFDRNNITEILLFAGLIKPNKSQSDSEVKKHKETAMQQLQPTSSSHSSSVTLSSSSSSSLSTPSSSSTSSPSATASITSVTSSADSLRTSTRILSPSSRILTAFSNGLSSSSSSLTSSETSAYGLPIMSLSGASSWSSTRRQPRLHKSWTESFF